MIASANHVAASVLTIGLAISASPFGIIGVLIALGTYRPLANAWAFVIGWMVSITAFGLVTYSVSKTAGGASNSSASSTSTAGGIVGIVVGALALAAGVYAWRTRGRASDKQPKWMGRARDMGPPLAFCLGLFLPTWGLIVPAVDRIAGAGMSKAESLGLFLAFVLAAASTLLLPLLLYTFRREWAASMLQTWQSWLLANSRAVGAVVLLVVGTVLVTRGVIAAA